MAVSVQPRKKISNHLRSAAHMIIDDPCRPTIPYCTCMCLPSARSYRVDTGRQLQQAHQFGNGRLTNKLQFHNQL